MIGIFLGFILKVLGGNVLGQTLGYLERRADSQTERQRISSLYSAAVIQSGMLHKVFWVAWGIATLPMAFWFGYGMINTILPGLPHEAAIPPGLKFYADNVWANVFFTGGVVASVNTVGNTISNIFARIFK